MNTTCMRGTGSDTLEQNLNIHKHTGTAEQGERGEEHESEGEIHQPTRSHSCTRVQQCGVYLYVWLAWMPHDVCVCTCVADVCVSTDRVQMHWPKQFDTACVTGACAGIEHACQYVYKLVCVVCWLSIRRGVRT